MAWMIDGNKLKEKAVPLLIPSEMELSGFLPNPVQAVMVSEIESMLYRDGIEIILCKDCKYSYCNKYCTNEQWKDNGATVTIEADDFCSYSERRGKDAVD